MRTNFVLIDSENVKPRYIEKLNHEYFRVLVFVGANQKRLNFPIANAIQSLGANGSYVQSTSNGRNALDFHIAYYIGKLSETHPDAYFHIISNDKGFDPLIRHLKEQRISCCRSASVSDIPLVKSTDKIRGKQRATEFYEKRIATTTKARPGTVMSLRSAVHSYFDKQLSRDEIAEVLKALIAAGHVVENRNKIGYPDHG